MSVIIKGMEMPQRCMDCGVDTGLCGLWNGYDGRYSRRHPKCPLVDIPTPHGRLIDADKLSNQKYENIWTNRLVIDADDLDDAPTVIEAEGSEIDA